MPAVSYAFAVGNVRAKEGALLKKQDIEQLLALRSVAAVTDLLKDKGYAYADTLSDIDTVLSAEEQKLWEYVASVAPDFSVFHAFIIGNDYHNIKAVFKGMAVGADYTSLLLRPTTVDIGSIEKAAREQNFSLLPEFCRDAAGRAWEALIKAGDPQLCDAVLDASMGEKKLKLAEELKISMLADIIRTTVFYDNIKAAIRCARAGKPLPFCDICLIDVPGLSKKRLTEETLKGVDAVLALVETVGIYAGADAVTAYKSSPGEFERFVDERLTATAAKARYVAVGPEPLVAYLLAKLAEIKTVRMIANGIVIGEDSEKTRGMLRKLYG